MQRTCGKKHIKKKIQLSILLLAITLLNMSCKVDISDNDLTPKILKNFEESKNECYKTTLGNLLNIHSADSIYINYDFCNFPNHQWKSQKSFLEKNELTNGSRKDLIFSDTLTSFFIIKNKVISKQLVVQSNLVKIEPDWYSPNIRYLAGVWNTDFNSLSDSIVVYPKKKEIVVSSDISPTCK